MERYDNSFNSWINKKDIKVIIDLSNYATKKEINYIIHVDTSNFALKTNFANIKTETGKLDIDKLATVFL